MRVMRGVSVLHLCAIIEKKTRFENRHFYFTHYYLSPNIDVDILYMMMWEDSILLLHIRSILSYITKFLFTAAEIHWIFKF